MRKVTAAYMLGQLQASDENLSESELIEYNRGLNKDASYGIFPGLMTIVCFLLYVYVFSH